MPESDLKDILVECKESAIVGSKIASAQYRTINGTLSNAADKIRAVELDFQSSPCYISGATEMLSQQLFDIESAFQDLSFAFKETLENRKETLSKFSVTLFGRTMAGKSTLMEILTEGSGESIGCGAQRTTRDVRTYTWNSLEITDVPGIGAFDGTEDEMIAYNAAKNADLILFLITDDAPQAIDADWFGRMVDLGKPIICVMNVKVSMNETKSLKLALHDIEKKFDKERLDTIRNEFLSYSQQLGQDWRHVPFIYVHLKSAFMSQHETDEEKRKALYQASRIIYLKNRIISEVREKGKFYRIKTFIDIVSKPMLSSMERLLNQSLVNSAQGRTIVAKKRQLANWRHSFVRDGKRRIESLIISIQSGLNAEIASFAEDHFDDKDADKAWDRLLEERHVQKRCQDLLENLEAQCNDKIKEVAREISVELRFSAAFSEDKMLKMRGIIDGKRIWDWSATILGGGFTIGAIIAGLFGAACAGPLGWIGGGLALVRIVGDFFFKSRTAQEQEARIKLETALRKNVTRICDLLEKRLNKDLAKLIEVRVDNLAKEMDRMNSVVFKLADTQKELAWRLDNHLLELNKQIVSEAIRLINAEGLEYHIQQVARIPGSTSLFMLNDGVKFPEEQKVLLEKMMSEEIGFIYDTEDLRVLVSRVLGKTVERNSISIEGNIGVAHVPINNLPPYMKNRIRLAQQFSRLAITE